MATATKVKAAGTNGKATQAKVAELAGPTDKDFLQAAVRLKMVSDATRLRILHRLMAGEAHVGTLCAHLGQSQPAVSHHLAILRHSGVVVPRRDGKHNYYALSDLGRELATTAETLVGA